MSAFETLRYEVDGGLARLTLARPDAMNAMAWDSQTSSSTTERHLRIASSADTAEAFRAFVEKRPPRCT